MFNMFNNTAFTVCVCKKNYCHISIIQGIKIQNDTYKHEPANLINE